MGPIRNITWINYSDFTRREYRARLKIRILGARNVFQSEMWKKQFALQPYSPIPSSKHRPFHNPLALPLLETGNSFHKSFYKISLFDVMSSKSTSQPAKRARTSGSTAGSVKGPQDVAEEWAQVNSLVERRRLQNRLSQKNYRAQLFPRFIIWWNTKLTPKAIKSALA